MNKKEREAIEEVIDLLEYEVRHNGTSLCIGSICVAQENEVTEALRILRRIMKPKGE